MKLIDKPTLNKFLQRDYVFVLMFALMACIYYDSVLDKGPLNVHIWRQTDCLSITQHYMEGTSFLEPDMHLQYSDSLSDGRSAGEFPILYYAVGNIWKVFGESYLSYRLVCLSILFFGLFCFFKSVRIVFDDFWIALLLSALLFTSPVLVVYGVSFLTDGPAFSFVLVALYFLVLYIRKTDRKMLYLAMAFFALAGLIKVSSLMIFFFMFIILVLESLSFQSLGTKKLFKIDRYEWIAFLSVFAIVLAWYVYAHYYNLLHGFKFTINNIYPIWMLKSDRFAPWIDELVNFSSYIFFSRPVLALLFLVSIANLFLWKKIPPFAYLANVILLMGSTAYFILWAPLLGIHDYYYVALLVLFLSAFLPFVWFIKNRFPHFFRGYWLKIILLVFVGYNFFYCKAIVELKTLSQRGNYAIIGNEAFVKGMIWENWNIYFNWNRFREMRPYLDEIGVKPEDKIISVPDQSPNASLYLLNRKGWTNAIDHDLTNIDKFIQHGAKYLFVSDPKTLQLEHLQPYLSDKIGEFKGIEVYRL